MGTSGPLQDEAGIIQLKFFKNLWVSSQFVLCSFLAFLEVWTWGQNHPCGLHLKQFESSWLTALALGKSWYCFLLFIITNFHQRCMYSIYRYLNFFSLHGNLRLKSRSRTYWRKKEILFSCHLVVDKRSVSCLWLLFEAQMQTAVVLHLKLIFEYIGEGNLYLALYWSWTYTDW